MVQNTSVIHEDDKCAIFLAMNRQVGICTKCIGVRHRFLRDMVENKDINIQYIWGEYNPADIITENTSEVDFAMYMERIAEG